MTIAPGGIDRCRQDAETSAEALVHIGKLGLIPDGRCWLLLRVELPLRRCVQAWQGRPERRPAPRRLILSTARARAAPRRNGPRPLSSRLARRRPLRFVEILSGGTFRDHHCGRGRSRRQGPSPPSPNRALRRRSRTGKGSCPATSSRATSDSPQAGLRNCWISARPPRRQTRSSRAARCSVCPGRGGGAGPLPGRRSRPCGAGAAGERPGVRRALWGVSRNAWAQLFRSPVRFWFPGRPQDTWRVVLRRLAASWSMTTDPPVGSPPGAAPGSWLTGLSGVPAGRGQECGP